MAWDYLSRLGSRAHAGWLWLAHLLPKRQLLSAWVCRKLIPLLQLFHTAVFLDCYAEEVQVALYRQPHLSLRHVNQHKQKSLPIGPICRPGTIPQSSPVLRCIHLRSDNRNQQGCAYRRVLYTLHIYVGMFNPICTSISAEVPPSMCILFSTYSTSAGTATGHRISGTSSTKQYPLHQWEVMETRRKQGA